jgi:hypothetical protein
MAIRVRGRFRIGGAGDKKVMDTLKWIPRIIDAALFLGRPFTLSPRVRRADSDLSPRAGRDKTHTAPREYFPRTVLRSGGEV